MRIVNSVTRIIARHHSASLVMPNSYPEWRNSQFAPNSHYWFLFLHTLPSLTVVFKLGYALFDQFYTEITILIKKCLFRLLSMASWRHTRGRLTPLVQDGNIQNGWKSRKTLSGMQEYFSCNNVAPTEFLSIFLIGHFFFLFFGKGHKSE